MQQSITPEAAAILGPCLVAGAGAMVGAVRWGVNRVIRRIDEGDAKAEARHNRLALIVDAQGIRLDDHGERIAYLQGIAGVPLKLPSRVSRAVAEAIEDVAAGTVSPSSSSGSESPRI